MYKRTLVASLPIERKAIENFGFIKLPLMIKEIKAYCIVYRRRSFMEANISRYPKHLRGSIHWSPMALLITAFYLSSPLFRRL